MEILNTIFVVVTHFVVDEFFPWRIYSCFDTDLFAEVGLEARAVVSFRDIDSRVEVVVIIILVGTLKGEFAFFVAVPVVTGKLYVDFGSSVFSGTSCVSKRPKDKIINCCIQQFRGKTSASSGCCQNNQALLTCVDPHGSDGGNDLLHE